MSEKIINVLYVDDEENNLISFKASFRKDFNVFTAISAKDAAPILFRENIHVLITDQRMPETTGTELLADAVDKYPYQTRILLTGFTDIDALADAVNRGHIFKYLTKPWDFDELKKAIEDGYYYNESTILEKETIRNLKLTIEELNSELKRKNKDK